MARTNYSSGSGWEDIIGYSRAVKTDNLIEVSGTVASLENGEVAAPGDPYGQTIHIYKKIEKVLQDAGSSLNDVIRVRMYVTDISRWKEYGMAHSEFFKKIKPCNTMVEVKSLIDPGYMVEIEATAMISVQ